MPKLAPTLQELARSGESSLEVSDTDNEPIDGWSQLNLADVNKNKIVPTFWFHHNWWGVILRPNLSYFSSGKGLWSYLFRNLKSQIRFVTIPRMRMSDEGNPPWDRWGRHHCILRCFRFRVVDLIYQSRRKSVVKKKNRKNIFHPTTIAVVQVVLEATIDLQMKTYPLHVTGIFARKQ